MNIRLYLACLCLLLPLVAGKAQQVEVGEVLTRMGEAFDRAGGMKVDFTIHASEGVSNGSISLKGEKFVLQAEGITTWFDGHTQWSYVADSDEVNLSEPSAEELQGINPYSWLSLYKQGYKQRMGKTTSFRGRPVHEVVLTTTQRSQDLLCIVLYVARDTWLPVRISMAQRGGEVTVITVNACLTGQSYTDAMFVFDKSAYPTAEIIDLR